MTWPTLHCGQLNEVSDRATMNSLFNLFSYHHCNLLHYFSNRLMASFAVCVILLPMNVFQGRHE